MTEQFRVVHKQSRGVVELVGDDETIVAWLKKAKDVSPYEVYSPSRRAYFSVSEFLTKHIIPEKYNDLMSKFYMMDPETEDLLPDGRHLADGMKVLIEPVDLRTNLTDIFKGTAPEWVIDRAMGWNRWATVSNIQIVGGDVKFVSIYDDGTKRVRTCNTSCGWFVKIDSIAKSMEISAKRYNEVFELLKSAMTEVTKAQRPKESDNVKAVRVGRKAEETTKKILGLL